MPAAATIEGTCDARFAALREAFAENLAEGGETGASIALMLEGRMLVDLWGGHADAARRRPWQRDTTACMMSVAKGFVALAAARLVERGLLDLDAPIARHWPAFAAKGKQDATPRQVLAHTAGIPVADAAPAGSIYDWPRMVAAIAGQAPLWPPGTVRCYHSATMGFVIGELVRRIDGSSFAGFVQQEIAAPLGLDYGFALAPAAQLRCAEMIPAAGTLITGQPGAGGKSALGARLWGALAEDEDFNSPAWRGADIPSANGHGTARAVARLYGALALGGALDGVRLLGAETLAQFTTLQWEGGTWMQLDGTPPADAGPVDPEAFRRMGLGWLLDSRPGRPQGVSGQGFGHSGAGGAQGFADPAHRLGFCYCPNRMHGGADIGPRARRLFDALRASL
jgi:CubicO group peptidase (beta-lactamase class C family)